MPLPQDLDEAIKHMIDLASQPQEAQNLKPLSSSAWVDISDVIIDLTKPYSQRMPHSTI